MKRVLMALVALMLLVIPNAPVGAMPAGPPVYVYDLGSGLLNGYWQEVFLTGTPGVDGDLTAANTDGQWFLSGSQVGSAVLIGSGVNYQDYTTSYGDVTLSLNDPGTFGSVMVMGMTGTNLSRHYLGENANPNLEFWFHAYGVNGDFSYTLEGHWVGNPYLLSDPGITSLSGESFIPFQSLTLEIAAVPVPASVLLFGSGLVGLVGIRRRFKTV